MFKIIKKYINDERIYWRFLREWKRAKRLRIPLTGKRILIVPCDPWGVVGSRGDQAMIMATLQHLRIVAPDLPVDILTDSHKTDPAVMALGMNPVAEWNEVFDHWIAKCAANYSQVIVIGADVTDGTYGVIAAMKLLMFYDIFSRLGAKIRYLGFSWSQSPHRLIGRVLRNLQPNLPLPVRDPVSYERLIRFTSHRPLVLVADAAFMLKPRVSFRVEKIQQWCKSVRKEKRRILALNVHPMFNDVNVKGGRWTDVFCEAISNVLYRYADIALVFLPHDNRLAVSDLSLLREVYLGIPKEFSDRCLFVDEVMDADEVKAVFGSVDGLIAGRMHISIAALGQGIPVCALVYQGKFEGLWQHFNLLSATMIQPRIFQDDLPGAVDVLVRFVETLNVLKSQIAARLPEVLRLSAENFKD